LAFDEELEETTTPKAEVSILEDTLASTSTVSSKSRKDSSYVLTEDEEIAAHKQENQNRLSSDPIPIVKTVTVQDEEDKPRSQPDSSSGKEVVYNGRPRSLENDKVSDDSIKVDKGTSLTQSLESVRDQDSAETIRHHRHSIGCHTSPYVKMCSPWAEYKGKSLLPTLLGSTGTLFSTAIISGSSSAPELKDMVDCSTTTMSDFQGCCGVPPIRPLETLHNALFMKQLDSFLERVTTISYRTPISTPPKVPSTPIQLRANKGSSPPLSITSPTNEAWSGPPSFVSSSGPSSPNTMALEFLSRMRQFSESSDTLDAAISTPHASSSPSPPDTN